MSKSKKHNMNKVQELDEMDGYFPSESLERLEHFGILCVTIYGAACISAKYSYIGYAVLEIPETEAIEQWVEIFSKAAAKGSLKTKSLKVDLNEQVDVFQTNVDLYDLRDWLEARDVELDDNFSEIIENRIKLLHKTTEFVETEALLTHHSESMGRPEDFLADRLEAALSENRRLQRLISNSAHSGENGIDVNKDVNKKSESAYINIIGALCDIYWKTTRPEKQKIVQSEIIAELGDYHEFAGLSERNLKDKLARGIKAIRFE